MFAPSLHIHLKRTSMCGINVVGGGGGGGGSSDPAVSSSIFVGAEREENLIRNDSDKSEFTKVPHRRK